MLESLGVLHYDAIFYWVLIPVLTVAILRARVLLLRKWSKK